MDRSEDRRTLAGNGGALCNTSNAFVLVQTHRAKKLYLVGKVIGPEGYEGPRDKIFPGEYLKFEFDGLTIDDLVWFERKNVALTF